MKATGQNREPGSTCAPVESNGATDGQGQSRHTAGTPVHPHTSGDGFRVLSHTMNKNNFQVD